MNGEHERFVGSRADVKNAVAGVNKSQKPDIRTG
jgi:hypothetical protein